MGKAKKTMQTITTPTEPLREKRVAELVEHETFIPHAIIHEALLGVQDLFERSMIPFILMDDIAQQMQYEMPQFKLHELSFGVLKQNLSESGYSMFKSLLPKDTFYEDATISFELKTVPIVIWVIHNNLDVFQRPDVRFYYDTEFHIPNPFTVYWKKRNFIK